MWNASLLDDSCKERCARRHGIAMIIDPMYMRPSTQGHCSFTTDLCTALGARWAVDLVSWQQAGPVSGRHIITRMLFVYQEQHRHDDPMSRRVGYGMPGMRNLASVARSMAWFAGWSTPGRPASLRGWRRCPSAARPNHQFNISDTHVSYAFS